MFAKESSESFFFSTAFHPKSHPSVRSRVCPGLETSWAGSQLTSSSQGAGSRERESGGGGGRGCRRREPPACS